MERILLAPIFTDEPAFAGNGFLILPEQLYVTNGHVPHHFWEEDPACEFAIAIGSQMFRVRLIHSSYVPGTSEERLPHVWEDFAVMQPFDHIDEAFLKVQPTYPAAFNMDPKVKDLLTLRPFYVSKGEDPTEDPTEDQTLVKVKITSREQLVQYEMPTLYSGVQAPFKHQLTYCGNFAYMLFKKGMSGAPLFDEQNQITGLGMGRIHESGTTQIGVVPIESVLDYLASQGVTVSSGVVQ